MTYTRNKAMLDRWSKGKLDGVGPVGNAARRLRLRAMYPKLVRGCLTNFSIFAVVVE